MEFVLLALRALHVLSACVMIGGLFFQRFAVGPSEAGLEESVRASLREARRLRWSRWVMAGITVLLISGGVNFYFTLKGFGPPLAEMPRSYHMVFGIKVLVALVLFFIGSVLTGRSARFEAVRRAPRRWLDAAILSAIVIVLLSAYLRSTHVSPPPATDGSTPSEEVGSAKQTPQSNHTPTFRA